MAECYHGYNEHELGQTAGDGEGQRAWCVSVHGVGKSWM